MAHSYGLLYLRLSLYGVAVEALVLRGWGVGEACGIGHLADKIVYRIST